MEEIMSFNSRYGTVSRVCNLVEIFEKFQTILVKKPGEFMGKDSSLGFAQAAVIGNMDGHAGCSKPKKQRSCTEDNNVNSQWTYLPSVVLHQIFDLLNAEDRKNASTVCKHWRKTYFHPKWWPAMKFQIACGNLPKTKFYASTFAHNVSHATVALNCLSPFCVYEFISLLRLFNENNRLQTLILEPSHCRLEESYIDEGCESHILEIIDLITAICPRLSSFSLGGLEDLAQYSDCLLRSLTNSKITMLGLASVRHDFTMHKECFFSPNLILSFSNLKILSVDYDQLSDKFLNYLVKANQLKRLVVHLHAISKDHPGTSNSVWKQFKLTHPECNLRLTVIHAYSAVNKLQTEVLREQMPLSHLKVFFCEDVNLELLHTVSKFYTRTIRSLMWIDSLNDFPRSYKFAKNVESPDPFVLMCWLCGKFEELVLYGYNYSQENLVGIARLKGTKMRKLEIPFVNVVASGHYGKDPTKEIASRLQDAWNPLHCDDLHPVILDPNSGDSDEFLLPLVLADLQ